MRACRAAAELRSKKRPAVAKPSKNANKKHLCRSARDGAAAALGCMAYADNEEDDEQDSNNGTVEERDEQAGDEDKKGDEEEESAEEDGEGAGGPRNNSSMHVAIELQW
jgi:hypothetical protein